MSTSTPISLEQYRQQFPALLHKTYFNYGGQGPLPSVALAAMQQAHMTFQEMGPFSSAANTWITEEARLTREAIGTALQVSPDTIVLTENVSMGCNIALWGIDWQPGDHILMSDCEHQGIIAQVQAVQRRFGVHVSTCPILETLNGGDPVAIVASHLQPNTRLVVLSHILWNTGQVLPLGDIVAACHHYPAAHPVQVLVDAAQSVGVLPLNLDELEVDFYAFTGHKWWCGPAGLGGLYIRPAAMPSLLPVFVGWRSVMTDESGQPVGWKPGAYRFEVATSDYPLYAGLRAALQVHDQWATLNQRYQQIQALSHRLWQQLRELPHVTCLRTTPPEAGLVSFQLAGRFHERGVQALEAEGILVRTIRHPNCIRACVHYLTSEAEIERLVTTIARGVFK